MSKSSARKRRHSKRKKHSPSGQIVKKQTPTGISVYLKRSPKTAILLLSIITIGILSIIVVPKLFIKESGELRVVYPFDGTLFPPEIIAPSTWWKDGTEGVENWKVTIEFKNNKGPIHAEVDKPEWIPERGLWESIKERSINGTHRSTRVRKLPLFFCEWEYLGHGC